MLHQLRPRQMSRMALGVTPYSAATYNEDKPHATDSAKPCCISFSVTEAQIQLACLDRAEKDRRIRSPVNIVRMSGRRRKIATTSSAAK